MDSFAAFAVILTNTIFRPNQRQSLSVWLLVNSTYLASAWTFSNGASSANGASMTCVLDEIPPTTLQNASWWLLWQRSVQTEASQFIGRQIAPSTWIAQAQVNTIPYSTIYNNTMQYSTVQYSVMHSPTV